MATQKIEIKKSRLGGRGVFAKQRIKKGDAIAEFDGKIYGWHSKFWNNHLENHCIQFEERKWRDSKGFAKLVNHSCNPNCGIKDLFKIVAIKTIEAGQELTLDYEMTEDCLWRMKCNCGSKNCRKTIGSFKNMPEKIRSKYEGYISEWLVKKYHLNQLAPRSPVLKG